jgi:hypothetical protein
MSSSRNINNILEDTIQRFFTDSGSDVSFNYLREWITTPPLYETETVQQGETETDSMPDLIDPEQDVSTNQVPPVASSDHAIQVWSNMITDYHSQMRMYQENVRTILDITQNFLPQAHNPNPVRNSNPVRNLNPTRNQNNSSFLTDLLRNNTYSIEIERMLPSLFSNNNVRPTTSQISSATTVFTYDVSNNSLTSNICPISLEEFRDGEQLTRIHDCGHVFKTAELSRWFLRNSHCPSCRYDIRRNS